MSRLFVDNEGTEWKVRWRPRMTVRAGGPRSVHTEPSSWVFRSDRGSFAVPRNGQVRPEELPEEELRAITREEWYARAEAARETRH